MAAPSNQTQPYTNMESKALQIEALYAFTKLAMRFFPIKNHIKVTPTLRQSLNKLPDEDLHEILEQLEGTINPSLQEYIRDLLYKRELEANKEYLSTTPEHP